MFAVDGVKLPSNASKQRSGTRAEFERQAAKLEVAIPRHEARLPPVSAPRAVPPRSGASDAAQHQTVLYGTRE